MNYRTACKIVAAGILLSMLLRWQVFFFASTVKSMEGVMRAFILATVALGLLSVVGIWKARKWGFVAFYPLVVRLPVLLGMSLIPFVPSLLPVDAQFTGVIFLNAAVLLLVATLHWKHPG